MPHKTKTERKVLNVIKQVRKAHERLENLVGQEAACDWLENELKLQRRCVAMLEKVKGLNAKTKSPEPPADADVPDPHGLPEQGDVGEGNAE